MKNLMSNISTHLTPLSESREESWLVPHRIALMVMWVLTTAAIVVMLFYNVRSTVQYKEIRYVLQVGYVAALLWYLGRSGPSVNQLPEIRPQVLPRWKFDAWIPVLVIALLFALTLVSAGGAAILSLLMMAATVPILLTWRKEIRLRSVVQGFALALVALLTFPFIHVVGTGITNVLNGDAWFPQISRGADLALTLFITFFSVLLFTGGINEESGWRGFAQIRLQAKDSPLVANLILWFLMVIWHIPNDIVQYRDGGYILVRIGLYPFITILFGWIYNRTKGSILAPAIFHASMKSMNPLMGVFPIATAGNILLVGLAIVAAISDRMWKKLLSDHPAVYQKPVLVG